MYLTNVKDYSLCHENTIAFEFGSFDFCFLHLDSCLLSACLDVRNWRLAFMLTTAKNNEI